MYKIKIYFGGKFNFLPNGDTLVQRLAEDFRSILLGNPEKMTFASEHVTLKNYPILYKGPFYCEQASNGDYTSTDCEVVVTEETKEIMNADIFCCVFDLKFSVGTITELIDAAYAKKRIVIFYKNESNNYNIKSEYWFAITRALQICKANGTMIEVFDYDNDVLPVLYNWLTNLSYTKSYICTIEQSVNTYLKNCTLINTYKYKDKIVYQYEDFNSKDTFVIEKYSNGVTMLKTLNMLDINSLVMGE